MFLRWVAAIDRCVRAIEQRPFLPARAVEVKRVFGKKVADWTAVRAVLADAVAPPAPPPPSPPPSAGL